VKIVLILPSISSGGLEKVLTELSWFFSQQKSINVVLISLQKGEFFYSLPSGIEIFMPSFSLKEIFRPFYLVRLMCWLRHTIKKIKPDALLSFGGKFNSFNLISVFGLHVQTYISDRSRPSISFGYFLDRLNPIMYKNATGIIAQTIKARDIIFRRTSHSNIRVIGNPLKINNNSTELRENIILNVGRFIPTKQQLLLVDYYTEIRPAGWKVCLIGEGPNLNNVRKRVSELGLENEIVLPGIIKNIGDYYRKSKIFAFTSSSEGFPNVLGEAMAAGLACISFDCEAGPSDLITDGENGFLVNENDHSEYIKKLKLLIEDESLCSVFGKKAREKAMEFSLEKIGSQYLSFITGNQDADSY